MLPDPLALIIQEYVHADLKAINITLEVLTNTMMSDTIVTSMSEVEDSFAWIMRDMSECVDHAYISISSSPETYVIALDVYFNSAKRRVSINVGRKDGPHRLLDALADIRFITDSLLAVPVETNDDSRSATEHTTTIHPFHQLREIITSKPVDPWNNEIPHALQVACKYAYFHLHSRGQMELHL
jgi:hypothetical protein